MNGQESQCPLYQCINSGWVVVWHGPRLKLAPQPALRVLLAARLAICKYILSGIPAQLFDIFRIDFVVIFRSFWYWLRICILSVLKKLWQNIYLIRKMRV